MSMSKSMPYYVTGLQTWAWAAVEHLLDGDNHPDGTPVWALTPTVSTSRDHTGGWTVTVTITTTDDEPLPCFPSSWSVSAVPARNGVVTVFRSMLDQRHAGNHETFTAWSEMLAELFDAWKRALSDGDQPEPHPTILSRCTRNGTLRRFWKVHSPAALTPGEDTLLIEFQSVVTPWNVVHLHDSVMLKPEHGDVLAEANSVDLVRRDDGGLAFRQVSVTAHSRRRPT